jgi:uncharacterized protein YidB (DUF937 family)
VAQGRLRLLRRSQCPTQEAAAFSEAWAQPVSPNQLGPALGSDVIKTLAQRSGLSEEELTQQLSQILPGVVDKLTPAGRLPTVAELSDAR